jgi:Tfp pilus assembly protein PilF
MNDSSIDIEQMEIRGKKLLNRDNLEKAKEIFDRILQIDAENLLALDKTGVIFARKGNLDEAELYFRKVISIDPGYKTALNNLGNVFLERGEIAQAKNCYYKAIEIDINYSQAYHNLAIAYKREGDIGNYIKNIKRGARLEKRENIKKIMSFFRGHE